MTYPNYLAVKAFLEGADTPVTSSDISASLGLKYGTTKKIIREMRLAGEVESLLTGKREGGRTAHRLIRFVL